jgi:hypothetical protein
VREAPELVETWYASGQVDLVVGCFSTALATAALYGVPTARVGTELLLERLNPYENSNRIPATVIAETVPPLGMISAGADSGPAATGALTTQQVVNTVGYLMQPSRHPDLRSATVELLEQHFAELRPYLRRSRLTKLGLPGGKGPAVAARLGSAGPLMKRMLGRRLSRQLGDVARRAVPLGQRR